MERTALRNDGKHGKHEETQNEKGKGGGTMYF